MVYITGDIHGYPERIRKFCKKQKLSRGDMIVILGDVGANYYLNWKDESCKEYLNKVKATVLCIHGNHESRPQTVTGYQEKDWNGGVVLYQPEYPNLLFAKDGEIYDLEGLRCMAIGGAYSVDKFYRLARGWKWFSDEQPSDEIKAHVERQLKAHPVDVIFSHTCPYRYRPVESFLPGVDQSAVDDSTERWLDTIEEMANYKAWYCGHWHIDKRIDRMHFLFRSFESLKED